MANGEAVGVEAHRGIGGAEGLARSVNSGFCGGKRFRERDHPLHGVAALGLRQKLCQYV